MKLLPNLVPYWKQWHKMHSVRFSALAAACATALASYHLADSFSPAYVSGIPHWVVTALVVGTVVCPLLAGLGSVIDQPGVKA